MIWEPAKPRVITPKPAIADDEEEDDEEFDELTN